MTKRGCLKIFGGLLLVGIIATTAMIYFMSEKLPEAKPSNEADLWAEEVMSTLGKESYDTTRYYQWTFFRPNHYNWDKKENVVVISWDENEVLLDLNAGQGRVINPKDLTLDNQKKILASGWSNWCNDSFWMFAPFKMMDSGTTRSITNDEEGNKGILVQYDTGGVTPGDSYLWLIGDNNIPTGYKMWTSVLPIKGLSATWEGWKDYGGIKLADTHNIKVTEAKMKDIKVGNTLEEMSWPNDLFKKGELISY